MSSSPRYGSFVITFQRPAILADTLQRLLCQTLAPEVILVIDNGASWETRKVVESLENSTLLYRAMAENVGPAGAAELGLAWLHDHGYEWMHWVDDDDPPPASDTMARAFGTLAKGESMGVGGFGMVGCRFDWQMGEMVRLRDTALQGTIEVDIIGGNQQLTLHRRTLEAVGLPDSRLFFGYEEPEYCLRIRRAGLKLLVDGTLMYECRQSAGRLNLGSQRSARPRLAREAMWRQYYGTRNYIFMMRHTFRRSDLAWRETLKAAGRAMFSWQRGPSYGLAFSKMQVRGIWDGYKGKMGRTVVPLPKAPD